jgi:hypothetical protein
MARVAGALLAALALLSASHARAADPAPAGNYKVLLPFIAKEEAIWLIKLETKDDKTTGSVVAADETKVPPTAKLEDVQADSKGLNFTLKAAMIPDMKFEFNPAREKGARMLGVVTFRGRSMPAVLEPTTLADLKPATLAKETLNNKKASTADVIGAAEILLTLADEEKSSADDVKGWLDRAIKAAEAHGDTLVRDLLLRQIERLSAKEAYAKIAVPHAQRLEKMLDDKKDPVAYQKRVLNVVATALEKGGKADEAKAVRARNDKLVYVTPTPFPGRKGKSDRVVLAELFTSVQNDAAVAADLALEAVAKSYKPSEVIVLAHHLHQPGPDGGPDPLSSPDATARMKFYSETFKGVPGLYLNGKPVKNVSGSFDQARDRYKELTEAINPLLEKSPKAKIKLTATRKDNKIDITAEVSGLDEAGDDVRLRLALVEREVRYADSPNKVNTFHNVVRAYPGGATGTALKEKTGSKSVTVDLEELRKKLTEDLDKLGKDDMLPSKERPLALKNLAVVAFVQNDDTTEVLQAVQVDVAD